MLRHINALVAANGVIVPVQCEYLSLRGLVQLENTLTMIRENLNPGGVSIAKRWVLSTALTVTRVDLGIQRNATATTSEINVTAYYSVSDATSGKVVYGSTSRAIGSRKNAAVTTASGSKHSQTKVRCDIKRWCPCPHARAPYCISGLQRDSGQQSLFARFPSRPSRRSWRARSRSPARTCS